MGQFQEAKKIVLDYFKEMEQCSAEQCSDVLKKYTSENYLFRGVYPFEMQHGATDAAKVFWAPLKTSLRMMQRRMDIFLGGFNKYGNQEIWVLSTGNFMGLFDEDWLGIRRTRKINCLRYAEFNCVENGKITQTAIFWASCRWRGSRPFRRRPENSLSIPDRGCTTACCSRTRRRRRASRPSG